MHLGKKCELTRKSKFQKLIRENRNPTGAVTGTTAPYTAPGLQILTRVQ